MSEDYDPPRRLTVDIPDSVFRRLSGYAGLQGLTMPRATRTVLTAGLEALGAPMAPSVPKPQDS